MDGFYRGVEASLLALTFALGLAAATLTSLPAHSTIAWGRITTTLPMISVGPDDPVE